MRRRRRRKRKRRREGRGGRRGRRRRRRRRRKYLNIHFLPHTTNAVSITQKNLLMLQLHGNSAGRSFFPCLTDKRQPNALPDTLPALRPTSSLGEF